MKKKIRPVAHKSENTFRFQTFAERLSNINIDVIHRIGTTTDVPEHSETFFSETLEKWCDLNYTEDYDELRRDLGPEIHTLPQLIYHQERIIRVLKQHLQGPNHALPAILELLVALARDVQSDFYPHFQSLFPLLLNLLTIHDAEMLEKVFSCLAYLFKYLWRCMVKEIKPVFRFYSTLLCSEKKEYIRNFAAESFAFLLRKVPDKEKLLLMLFKNLVKNPSHAVGTGQLLFEVVKGVKNQFHSCAENMLTLMLQVLTKSAESNKVSFELAQEAVLKCSSSMAKHASPEYCAVIWKVYRETLQRFSQLDSFSEVNDKQLQCILAVFSPFVEYKDASLLREPSPIFTVMTNSLRLPGLSKTCVNTLLDILAAMLQSSSIAVEKNDIACLLSVIFDTKQPFDSICNFSKKLFKHNCFKKEIFPVLYDFCEVSAKTHTDDVLNILTSLILHETSSDEGFPMASDVDLDFSPPIWSEYKELASIKQRTSRNVSIEESSLYSAVVERLEFSTADTSFRLLASTWSALLCLPYFKHRIFNQTSSKEKVRKLILDIHGALLNDTFQTQTQCDLWCFIFTEAISTLLNLNPETFLESVPSSVILELLQKFPSSVPLLSATVLFFTESLKATESVKNVVDLEFLYNILNKNLASPVHMVRKTTLQLFAAFKPDLPSSDEEVQVSSQKVKNVFEICLEAERVTADIYNVRQKLIHLQSLEYSFVQKCLPVGLYHSVPVYYLIGNLYINFKLVWQPVLDLLKPHAENMGKAFWEIYTPHLQESAALCEQRLPGSESSDAQEETLEKDPKTSLFWKHFLEKCRACYQEPDRINHRQLLWKAMELFPQSAEARNRDLVPLFIRFIQNEYCLVDTSISSTEDITKFTGCPEDLQSSDQPTTNKLQKLEPPDRDQTSAAVLKTSTVQESVNANSAVLSQKDENDEVEVSEKMDTSDVEEKTLQTQEEKFSPLAKKKRKATSKSLCCHLSVFSKFQNPRALYKEPELYSLYLQLLSHRDAIVQKLAFDCVATYNHKFLSPYKKNFYNILDEKTFKTEIVLFSVDSDFGVVHENDRKQLLPILMRILLGKMFQKTRANSGGKANSHIRNSIVLRFLAGCTAEELKVFLELVFVSFRQLPTDALAVVEISRSSLNLSAVLPLKQQLSIIHTLGVVFVQLGSLISDHLSWMLRVILSVLTTATGILDRRGQVYPSYISMVKSLRNLTYDRLIQFFTVFDAYPFTADEIDAIFEATVWPQLPRLVGEGLSNPPPLLRLVSVWSNHPRFFPLLGKYKVDVNGHKLCVLLEMLKLYVSPRIQQPVLVIITNVIENMLTFEDFQENQSENDSAPVGPTILVNYEAEVDITLRSSKGLNYGSLLLHPYVSFILQRLEFLVEKLIKNSKKLLSHSELNILARISEFVDDSEQSHRLVKMLIPFLVKSKRRNEEVEKGTLTSIMNLTQKVKDPGVFVRSLCPLFSLIHARQSRSILCATLEAIARATPTFSKEANIITKLNAWNPKLMEEPDFMKRLEGFKEGQLYITAERNVHFTEFLLLLIHNCTYFIVHVDDSAIRDNASYTLQKMAALMSTLMTSDIELFRLLVCDTWLDSLKKGLCNKNENVRHEFINVLASLLVTCGSHPHLASLAQLCNEDGELDFWENIKHIQLHRRARAMRRLSNALTDGTLKISSTTLAAYVLPLASAFLYEPSYSKHTSLVDAAIELVGAICRHLPWNRYEIGLKYYLSLLSKSIDQHKVTVKVIVAILDAFHFDLSKSRQTLSVGRKAVEENLTADVESEDDNNEDKEAEDSSENRKQEILDEEKATKIHETITKHLLPRLQSCLTQKTQRDEEHKTNKSQYPEDEEILRIPIALAMVKLLQNLPHGTLNQNLPGVFLKVVQFLRSRADSIREMARDTILKIMLSLGPRFFGYLLQEMKGSLKKGYQVHVMVYTTHMVLTNFTKVLSSGDLDNCISTLTEICHEELFGDIAEEKEVDGIKGKLKEARSCKSYGTYQILGQFVSESAFEKLVSPLRNVLSSTHSHKKVVKIRECLRHIVLGIASNKAFDSKPLLIYVYEFIMSGFDDMSIRVTKQNVISKKKSGRLSRPDIFLIPVEPPRGGIAAKASTKTNAHVWVEFGLQLLYFCLKRDKISAESQEHLQMLDPYIAIMAKCLATQNIKVITTCLRCLTWLVKFPLPSLEEHIKNIIGTVFVLLNKYSGPGMGQGENFEMVVMSFKLLTVTLRGVPSYQLSSEQLRVLLIYIDQDVHDHTRQATAFTLLKAVLSRHLESPELPGVMKKVAEMSIVSEQENIRAQCRQALLLYMLEYPLKKGLTSQLGFFVVQLKYEYESGRVSALEMLNTIFTTFPVATLRKHSGLFLVPLSASLVNDASSKCRQMASFSIKNLLSRLEHNDRSSLFAAVTSWLNDEKLSHQRLGAQLVGLFAESEKEAFESRLDSVLPLFKEHLSPDHYVSAHEEGIEERDQDYFLYHMLSSLLKVLTACKGLFTESQYQTDMSTIWGYVSDHLLYPHAWVRLASSQLFGMLFAAHPVEDLLSSDKCITKGSKEPQDSYLLVDTKRKLKTLASDFCSQLRGTSISEAHSEQIVRNLVYLSKVAYRFPSEIRENALEIPLSVDWIFQRLRREVNSEVSLTPSSTIKRKSVFKWLAAVALDMDKAQVVDSLPNFLRLLCRELSDNSPFFDTELKTLSQEVVDVLKGIVGLEVFTRELIQAQTSLSKKKTKRKTDKAVEVVNNPVVSARRKIKRNLKKQESRKRKYERLGGKRDKNKKPKLADLAIFS